MRYLKYLRYVLRHRWFVMLECFKYGLIWQGLVHDLSKFSPDEFIPYANFFYGDKPPPRDATGYYKPTDTGDKAFDFAWLLHQKRNLHHWQFWLLPEDDGGIKLLEIPDKYCKEMICDWKGAGRAQGYGNNTRAWYAKNKNNMQLHTDTRRWVEDNI